LKAGGSQEEVAGAKGAEVEGIELGAEAEARKGCREKPRVDNHGHSHSDPCVRGGLRVLTYGNRVVVAGVVVGVPLAEHFILAAEAEAAAASQGKGAQEHRQPTAQGVCKE
jgi:hypothetical protein